MAESDECRGLLFRKLKREAEAASAEVERRASMGDAGAAERQRLRAQRAIDMAKVAARGAFPADLVGHESGSLMMDGQVADLYARCRRALLVEE